VIGGRVVFAGMNAAMPPLVDVRVRTALLHAVDRKAIGFSLRGRLPVAHLVGGALLVELDAALTEAKQRPFRKQKRHAGRVCVQPESLYQFTFDGLDNDR
jgi:hypothetical protein